MSKLIKTILSPVKKKFSENFTEVAQPLQDLYGDQHQLGSQKNFNWNRMVAGERFPHIWQLDQNGLSLRWATYIDSVVEAHWSWYFELHDDPRFNTQTHKLVMCFELKSDLIQIMLSPRY